MQDLPSIANVYEDFMKNPDSYKRIFDSQKPQEEKLPGAWH
jgi:hypothetical protein